MGIKRKYAVLCGIFTCLVMVGVGSSMAFAQVETKYWPYWPGECYYPEPPKLTNNDEIVVDGKSTEPLSFFSVGRDIMVWVNRIPMVSEGTSPEQRAWGGELELFNAKDGEELSPEFLSTFPIYCRQKKATGSVLNKIFDNSDTENALILQSVIPAYKKNWWDKDRDKERIKESPNQEFPWIGSWIDFLKKTEKYGEVLGDPGHAAPVAVWADNVWLAKGTMDNWISYYRDRLLPKYEAHGGTLVFQPSNDGLLHAFEVNPANTGSAFKEIWSFMPPPAFQWSIYHEHIKCTAGSTAYPRIVTIDGPIAVHDVEKSRGKWMRLLVGTTGQGSDLVDKPVDAWNAETNVALSEDAPNRGYNGHTYGVYAIDITDPDSPSLRWSVTSVQGEDDGKIWLRENLYENGSLPSDYSAFANMNMSPTRPIFGYTQDGSDRTWHVVILGIDRLGYYRILDINAIDGSILHDFPLSEKAALSTFGGAEYPDDVFRPSRIGAALPWNERTPLLKEIYIFLSNGSLYELNLQDGGPPCKLLDITGTQKGNKTEAVEVHAQPLQDFDVTYVEVDGEYHRFLAAVCGFPKSGNPSNIIDTEHFGLLVFDLDKLKKKSIPVTLILGKAIGSTKKWHKIGKGNYAKVLYLSLRAPDDANGSEGSHWKTAYPSSSPVFYDGKIVLVTRGYWAKEHGSSQYIDAWSRIYVSDSINEKFETIDTRGVTHLGGSLIDEEGVLYSSTTDGILSKDLKDLGLEPTGGGLGSLSDAEITPGAEIVYWRISK